MTTAPPLTEWPWQYSPPEDDPYGLGTLTAAGTSAGATKAWQSRDRVLSPAEAEAWAAGSALPNTLYHGTSADSAAAIEAHGFDLDAARAQHGNMLRGVYFTESPEVARQYAAQNGGRVVAARAKVDKVATFDDVMEVAHTLPKDLPLADFEAQLTSGLTAKGYDAARFLNDEVTVFDPHEIAVFDPNKLRAIDPGLVAAGTSAGAKKAWESRQRAKSDQVSPRVAKYTVDPAVPPRAGFPPPSEYFTEELAAQGAGFTDPAVADLKKRMATDPIAVRMGAKGINGLVKDGRFKTIAETKSSRGTGRMADYKQHRWLYEEKRLGVDLQDKAATPVYGYLASGREARWAVKSYGDFEVRLKDDVKNRASVTEGDSLNGLRPVAFGEIDTATDFDWWKAHEPAVVERTLAVGVAPADKAGAQPIYTEAQVYGGVKLSDVSEVIIHNQASLSTATRAGLVKAGIKISEGPADSMPGFIWVDGTWKPDPYA